MTIPDEADIFNEARRIGDPAARAAYLAQTCGPDASLRNRIESLLGVHEQQASFLESPAVGLATADLTPPMFPTPPGTVIGRYKLLEPIGEGGYGTVFMAEQTAPVQRKVALKIIKAGMDTRQVIARFEAERQALALMDHPNIARVFDAGVTDAGRPYFVMELVKGTPITKYCDEHKLTPRQRLELFIQVCQAVQHAHQKGIIHRDLKPTNVLVAQYDGKPVPKVIDFGVAKATGQRLTERTMFTGFGDVIGTPQYMSPEQAELNQLDVDTRSDIYSLGVLLYELLTGTTPLEGERIKRVALLEVLRVIREEEPPKPSARLTTTAELPSIAATRGLEPKKLSALVHGELDWIVMKSLEKDRSRRYDTATSLARDVERYLADEAVEACPPSAGYRFIKFARRHRAALATALLLTISGVVTLGGIGWALRDRAARDRHSNHERTTRQARIGGQLDLILEEVERLQRAEKWSEALVSARRAEPALASGEAPLPVQERVRRTLADLELVRRLDEIRANSGTPWRDSETRTLYAKTTDRDYADALREAGIDVDAQPVEQAVDAIKARPGIAAALLPALDDWVAVRSMRDDEAARRRLIDVIGRADLDPWRRRVREALARQDWPALRKLVASPELSAQPAATLSFLYASLPPHNLMHAESIVIIREAQRKYPADYWINLRLGTDLIWNGQPQEGMGFVRAAVAVRPQSAHAVMLIGLGYDFMERHAEAAEHYRKALDLNPNCKQCRINLGMALSDQELYDQAVVELDRAVLLRPIRLVDAYLELSLIYSCRPEPNLRDGTKALALAEKAHEIEAGPAAWLALGMARYRQGELEEALANLQQAVLQDRDPARRTQWHVPALFVHAMIHQRLDRPEEALRCYRHAVASISEKDRERQTLIRFRDEAKALLKIADETSTPEPESQ